MTTASTMNILSVQSAVAYGHVGNSAAVFPLQRLGFEVWPGNTVAFSNHPGYGSWRGRLFGPRPPPGNPTRPTRPRGFGGCAPRFSGLLGGGRDSPPRFRP